MIDKNLLLANNTSAPTVASSASAAINSSLNDQSTLPNPTSTNPSSTANPSTVVTSSTNSNPTTTNPTERDRKRNRYDPRWLDGSLREELFGRIDRELKPDDLSLVKDNNSTKTSSLRKDQNSTSTTTSQSNPPSYQQQNSAPTSLSLSSTPVQNPIIFGDQLQYWTDFNSENSYPRFTHIAGLYSELIAINTNGQLCQWNWQDDYPYQDSDNSQIKHPKTLILQILNEKIINLSANIIRASILTETNRLATWIDESLGSQVNFKFQHSLQELSSPIPLRIIDIQTSPLFTIIRTDTNDLYWYGLLPNKPRKKLLERLKEKTRKNRTNNSSQSQSQQQQQQQIITIGSSVCLISNPYYNQGALAFYIRDGQPKLGQLMEQAWMLSNTARFRIKIPEIIINKNKEDDKSSLEMPPPPSPASSTCSVDSNTSFASSLKRKKHNNTTTTTATTTTTTNTSGNGSNPFLMTINDSDSNEQHSKIKDEEYWPLDEVIFIEDCKVAPIGKVVKIDGSLVLVKFPSKNTDINETNIDMNNLENCRILRKDDLQIVKGNTIPKTPDCTLSITNAKQITLEHGKLLTYSVDKDYLHTLQIRDSTIYYIMYEIGSNNGLCRSIRQNILPLINNRQSLLSFIGNGNYFQLLTLNSIDIPRILIDGNRLYYPFIYNQDGTNLKEPQWKNLLGLNYFSQGIIPLKNADHLNKNHIILNIMQIQKGILIPHILRYDIDKIRLILNDIEINKNRDLLKLILDERLDGCRNLFHACIQISTPLNNKEYSINDEQIQNETNNNLRRISFAIDLLHSQNNTDHNYGERTSSNTWSNESSTTTTTDAQPPSSPGNPSNLYRSSSANPGSLSPSYNPTSLSSKIQQIQYLQNQLYQQPPTRSSRTNSNDFSVWSSCKYDEREKRLRSIKILRLLLDYPLFQEHLLSLLSFRNLEGQTPFMSAVNSRAYHSALILFEYALKISKREEQQTSSIQFYLEPSSSPTTTTINDFKQSENILLRMIYPLTSTNSDYSPLYTICTNDTCSFTWTGEEHISQAIFECKTCGLSGTLCCCSECAQTCHKGHDCRLKRTSPTAYCDCWEVCKCKSLIAGDQQKRLELFKLLLNQTNLVQIQNSRYENILLYLVQTVGRQLIEQQQFPRTSTAAILQQQARKSREQLTNTSSTSGTKKLQHQNSSSGTTSNNNNNSTNQIDLESNSNIPDHHLEPPQFCRRALELILADWAGVKSMLLCGCPDDIDPTIINPKEISPIHSTSPPIMSTYDNEHIFSLDQQQQTSQLDRFTYFLLAKCNTNKQTNSTISKSSTSNDLLDILLNTLSREMLNPIHRDMARFITARFVRSVIRLFIILSLESTPDKTSSLSNQQLSSNTTIKRISATTVTGATITTSSNLSSSSSSSTTLNGPQSILFQCKRIFQNLTLISINALVHTADLLLAPVRHGIAKPTAMFNLLSSHTDILQGLEEVFNIDSEYYRAYQENKTNQFSRTSENLFTNYPELNETDIDDNQNLTNPININQTTIELNEDDDNNSDTQSQHEAINPINNSNLNEQQTIRESAGGLSDNESEMELELLAESDTDNESNRSAPNTNTHRTSATAGSENMALFSDDENSESDDADSVRSDSVLGEGDETSQPEPMIFDDARDALAAAAASSTATTTTATPNTVTNDRLVLLPSGTNPTPSNTQTPNSSTTSHLNVPRLNARTTMASSLFGDSHSRRQITPVATTSPSLNHPTSVSQQQQQQQQTHVQQQQQSQPTNIISVNTTNALLARAFGILIRQITDLLIRWPTVLSSSSLYHDVLTTSTTVDEQNALDTIQNEIEQCLFSTWQWFATVMDSFESQLRFGMALSNLSHNENDTTFHGNRFLKNLIDRVQIETKKKSTTSLSSSTTTTTTTTTTTNRTNNLPINDKPVNNRLDFLNYSLSLMRSIHEHGDQEPLLDVLSYKHLAYLLDAFIYYFRENSFNESNQLIKSNWRDITDESTNDNTTNDDNITSNSSFFQRSSSTLCLSSLGPDPFQITIDDSLPLACRPQLLQPICRKEDLFGRFLYDQTAAKYSHLTSQLGLSHREHSIPDFLQPNYFNLFHNNEEKTNIKTKDDDRKFEKKTKKFILNISFFFFRRYGC
jgi:E3 ubiquitin-protein ligase EDD1